MTLIISVSEELVMAYLLLGLLGACLWVLGVAAIARFLALTNPESEPEQRSGG